MLLTRNLSSVQNLARNERPSFCINQYIEILQVSQTDSLQLRLLTSLFYIKKQPGQATILYNLDQ